ENNYYDIISMSYLFLSCTEIETTEENFEKWLIGHTCELRNAKISIPKLRVENLQYAQALEHAAFEVIQKFLKRIGYSG
ncbi:hypothetical protein, partial [Acinetobacter baumannii]